MLIYHTHCLASCSKQEKSYKSAPKERAPVNRRKVLGSGGSKKSSKNKKLTAKNKRFLEGIGLKVKQSIENC